MKTKTWISFFNNTIPGRISSHLMFWGAAILYHYLVYVAAGIPVSYSFWNYILLSNGVLVGVVYLYYFFILPFCRKEQYLFFAVLTFSYLALISYINTYLNLYFNNPSFLYLLLLNSANVALVSFFHLYRTAVRNNEVLREEQAMAELKFLKHQIEPHFFFNTINSLYALSLSNSEQTAPSVLRFGELMHYIFETGSKEIVSLETEVTYLNNYLEMERLRLNERVTIQFQIEGALANKSITPLLLLPFVENAFKHGPDAGNQHCLINMYLNTSKGLYFSVQNDTPYEPVLLRSRPGSGLHIVQKRLQLLYPNRHMLHMEAKEHKFYVELTLPL